MMVRNKREGKGLGFGGGKIEGSGYGEEKNPKNLGSEKKAKN